MLMEIDWSNGTGSAWQQYFLDYRLHSPFQWIEQQPPSVMPTPGLVTLEVDAHLSDIVNGDCYVFCGWYLANYYWFGMRIDIPQQGVHIGDWPYYSVAGSVAPPASEAAIAWRNPVTDPSMHYTFAAPESVPNDLIIEVAPTVTGTTLQLGVEMKHPTPPPTG